MVRNIAFSTSQARGDVGREYVSQQIFGMLLRLLDLAQIFSFERPQRAPPQYRRNPGAQDYRIERLSQVIVSAEFDAFRYFIGIRVGADHDDRNVSRIRIGFDDFENLVSI